MDILKLIGIAAAIGSAAAWAIGSILFKKIGEAVHPLAMTLTKGFLASLLLFPFIFLFDISHVPLKNLFLLIISGLLGISIGDTLFFWALSMLSAHTLVVFMMLGQITTVIIAVIFLGEQPSLITWASLGMILTGVYIVLYANIADDDPISNKNKFKGIVIAAVSMICMSVSIIIAKPALDNTSSILATFIRMLSGTAGVFLLGALKGDLRLWIKSIVDTKYMAFYFVRATTVITFGGFWLFLVAIKYCDVTVANTLGATEPIFVLLFGWILYKQKPSLLQTIGTIVAFIGTAVLFTHYTNL